MKAHVKLVRDKETKRTIRFKQDDREDELYVPGITVVYVGKELVESLGDPEVIHMELLNGD